MNGRVLGILILLLMSACTNQTGILNEKTEGSSSDDVQRGRVHLDDLGPAPELAQSNWLNTDEPLTLEGLRGQVVLIDFWTYG
jgi:hypothetical protein